ncbi:hypothetical protein YASMINEVIRUS_1415 [Yasminevirus sp. GU-2018]|uniref:YbhB/YbcL family Raf kinase inhibitor-like protein n=1 Tax=Yasminevirus sp. GU-2018 TaxID=2420051 RepID=A0A5K0UBC3_9VIRU|nr:hypothetical protein YASMINEVIRUS_1415 [Yasminevirus sp. GU-2018]
MSATQFKLSSRDIENNLPINKEFTMYGENRTPNMSWSVPPADTAELLLICYDPDAKPIANKVWVHWIVSGISPSKQNLENGTYDVLKNDFSNKKYEGKAYNGPRPPPNTGVHNYHFKIFALKTKLNLDVDAKYSYDDIMTAVEGHVLAESEIVGTYVQ